MKRDPGKELSVDERVLYKTVLTILIDDDKKNLKISIINIHILSLKRDVLFLYSSRGVRSF